MAFLALAFFQLPALRARVLAGIAGNTPPLLKELDNRFKFIDFPHFPNTVLEQALKTATRFSAKSYNHLLVVIRKIFDFDVEHK